MQHQYYNHYTILSLTKRKTQRQVLYSTNANNGNGLVMQSVYYFLTWLPLLIKNFACGHPNLVKTEWRCYYLVHKVITKVLSNKLGQQKSIIQYIEECHKATKFAQQSDS